RPVSRHEAHVVAQRKEPLADRPDQGVVVAARKISASDGPGEEHVAHPRAALPGMKEHHVPGRVSRAMQYLERLAAHRDAITLLEPPVGLEGPCRREAELRRLLRQGGDPEKVFALRAF